jgi:hypothetical protein
MVSVGMESKERGEGHDPLALDFMPLSLRKHILPFKMFCLLLKTPLNPAALNLLLRALPNI